MDHMEYNIALPLRVETTNAGAEWVKMKQRLYIHMNLNSSSSQSLNMSYLINISLDQVQEVFNMHGLSNEETLRFNRVLKSIEDICLPRFLIIYNRYRFLTCKQNGPEFNGFLQQLLAWSDLCEFGDLKDILLKDCIISGISEESVRQRLLRTEQLDFDKTVEICKAGLVKKYKSEKHRARDYQRCDAWTSTDDVEPPNFGLETDETTNIFKRTEDKCSQTEWLSNDSEMNVTFDLLTSGSTSNHDMLWKDSLNNDGVGVGIHPEPGLHRMAQPFQNRDDFLNLTNVVQMFDNQNMAQSDHVSVEAATVNQLSGIGMESMNQCSDISGEEDNTNHFVIVGTGATAINHFKVASERAETLSHCTSADEEVDNINHYSVCGDDTNIMEHFDSFGVTSQKRDYYQHTAEAQIIDCHSALHVKAEAINQSNEDDEIEENMDDYQVVGLETKCVNAYSGIDLRAQVINNCNDTGKDLGVNYGNNVETEADTINHYQFMGLESNSTSHFGGDGIDIGTVNDHKDLAEDAELTSHCSSVSLETGTVNHCSGGGDDSALHHDVSVYSDLPNIDDVLDYACPSKDMSISYISDATPCVLPTPLFQDNTDVSDSTYQEPDQSVIADVGMKLQSQAGSNSVSDIVDHTKSVNGFSVNLSREPDNKDQELLDDGFGLFEDSTKRVYHDLSNVTNKTEPNNLLIETSVSNSALETNTANDGISSHAKLPVSEEKSSSKKEKRLFPCQSCNSTFKTATHLKVHTRLHTGERPFVCSTCNKGFREASKLKLHQRHHAGERPYKCSDCSMTFKWSAALNRHKRTHTGERPYKCNHCSANFASLYSLQRHKRSHLTQEDRPYRCMCGSTFVDPSTLRIHKRIHTGERPYSCTVCGNSFARAQHLKEHSKIHTGEKPFSCETCDAKFSEASRLKCHVRIHTGEKPYQCKLCDKRFTWTGGLTQHMRSHSSEKLFVCRVCGKAFANSSSLNTHHRRVHLGDERPFECTECSATFTDRSALSRHVKTHTDQKNFVCPICESSFALKKYLCRHMLTHTGEKKYKCDQCSAKFIDSSKLSRHKKIHFKAKNLKKEEDSHSQSQVENSIQSTSSVVSEPPTESDINQVHENDFAKYLYLYCPLVLPSL